MKLAALALLVGLCACSKGRQEPKQQAVPPMPAEEVKRNEDACKAYVERVCACTVPAAAEQCKLARALPEAIQIALDTARGSDSAPDIVQQSYASVRKTAKECIEQTAKLPTLGCP